MTEVHACDLACLKKNIHRWYADALLLAEQREYLRHHRLHMKHAQMFFGYMGFSVEGGWAKWSDDEILEVRYNPLMWNGELWPFIAVAVDVFEPNSQLLLKSDFGNYFGWMFPKGEVRAVFGEIAWTEDDTVKQAGENFRHVLATLRKQADVTNTGTELIDTTHVESPLGLPDSEAAEGLNPSEGSSPKQ